MGCHFLLQGLFPTQESNLDLLHYRQILYYLSLQGSPMRWLGRGYLFTYLFVYFGSLLHHAGPELWRMNSFCLWLEGIVAPWHCKILVPGPGVKPTSSAFQGGLLTTDPPPPGKSLGIVGWQ